MEDYLFLIPCSPNASSGTLRADLQKLCFSQLGKLKCAVRVWLLGKPTHSVGHFETITCSGTSKEEKLKEAGDLLSREKNLPKYLVRLDDDDLINPAVFDKLAEEDFDIAYDPRHFFYDLASDRVSSQKRDWIANTAIHLTRHALTRVQGIGGAPAADGMNYLFACDHSAAWHPFYEGKRRVNPEEPLYLRVLNPESITAKAEFSENNYIRYLSKFGNWKGELPEGMKELQNELIRIREDHLGERLKFRKKRRLFTWKG
jgi:glycosyltransferase involved in cell wall biosynthesis